MLRLKSHKLKVIRFQVGIIQTMKIRKIFKFLQYGGLRGHFGQYGEDIFVRKFFRGKMDGFYIDVGAHHPFQISNTAYLWMIGWSGVNVDASLDAIRLFDRIRSSDLNIHAAIISPAQLPSKGIKFFSSKAIDNCATCDPEMAKERGYRDYVVVPCMSLSEIVSQAAPRFNGQFDYLNIDIEGYDEQALEDIDSWAMKPRVISVEIYAQSVRDLMDKASVKILERNGYSLVERVGHTVIFVNLV